MDEEQTLEQFVESMAEACERLVDDFERLRGSLVDTHPEWTPMELAANLMELGRDQTHRRVGVEYGVDQLARLPERQARPLGHFLHEIGFVHFPSPPGTRPAIPRAERDGTVRTSSSYVTRRNSFRAERTTKIRTLLSRLSAG